MQMSPYSSFNPRSREGNDSICNSGNQYSACFNPRSREGNDPEPQRPELPIFKFQSTFPQGERHRSETSKTRCGSTFQSTFPQGERQRQNRCISAGIRGFNPRSRKGNDQVRALYDSRSPVSIHVPARGTTRAGFLPPPSHPVSIHVPARGTTAVGDPSVSSLVVSIHVPARGTTRSVLRVWRQYQGFNPRSRKGNDCQCSAFPDGVWLFQSTFPQGERRLYVTQRAALAMVSIHVPARGTTSGRQYDRAICTVSIHVPARGTTDHIRQLQYFWRVSIHVPARGTTEFCIFRWRVHRVSIHVPARGTTSRSSSSGPSLTFQSTFPQGERLLNVADWITGWMFQSTFPQGERLRR